jgi:hypothetical protein
MRLVAVVLLTSSLAGCVGAFTNEAIEGRYQTCMTSPFKVPLSADQVAWFHQRCADNRAFDYDYRFSLRRLVPEIPAGGSCGPNGCAPVQVIIMN